MLTIQTPSRLFTLTIAETVRIFLTLKLKVGVPLTNTCNGNANKRHASDGQLEAMQLYFGKLFDVSRICLVFVKISLTNSYSPSPATIRNSPLEVYGEEAQFTVHTSLH